LPDDQPVFGLQAVGLDGSVAAHSDVKDIARHCVSSLQKIQEHGPYRIIGYCAAGLFAFETVRQLIAGGEEIEYFALLDTAAPVARLRDRVRREIARLASADGLARITAKGYRFIRSQLANRPPTGAASIGAAHQHAVESFRPSPIPGEAVMYYCEDGNRKRDVAFGWDRLLSRGLILKGTPGDHETMMRTPNVSTLAKSISMDLDRLNGIGK
jgi:thioesterase domain-containing protein